MQKKDILKYYPVIKAILLRKNDYLFLLKGF